MANRDGADFGQAFVDKKQFQAKFEQIKLQRRVHAGAIYRERGQLNEGNAVELPKGVLEIRLANLNNNYAGFVKEHKELVVLISMKDKSKFTDQENYAIQVEKDYLQTAGELQSLINDKDFLEKAAELEESNKKRFGGDQIAELRADTNKRAGKVLENARRELNKIRADKDMKMQKSLKDKNAPSGSGVQVPKTPLEQLMTEYFGSSDSEMEIDAIPMSNEEMDEELKRYESQNVENNTDEQTIEPVLSPLGSDEYVPKLLPNIQPTPSTYAPMPIDVGTIPEEKEIPGSQRSRFEPQDDQAERHFPKSAVTVVNKVEHNDLRNKLKASKEPLHYKGAERTAPYRKPSSWVPGRELSCFNCNGRHAMSKCQKFYELPLADRRRRVQQLNLCENCFSPMVNEYGRQHCCRSGVCRRCDNGYHNSLLCYN